MAEIMKMFAGATIASKDIKGYKFHCAQVPNKCQECGQELTDFITTDVEQAFQHSKRNRVAMWISKDE